MSDSQLVINVIESEDKSSPISCSTPTSPFLLSPKRDGVCHTNSFSLCSDLIDYFDNKFVQKTHAILDDLRETLPKVNIITKVNVLCAQMNTLSDILTSLQQDLIQQLLKNVNFELKIFNDRMQKVSTQEDINKFTVEIIQQLVFLLENIMQAEQKEVFDLSDLIDVPIIANLEPHVFDEIWRKYLKPRNLTILPFSPQRSSSLCIARKSIDIRSSMLLQPPTSSEAELRALEKPNKAYSHLNRNSDGYGSSTSSSRPTSQEVEEYISVEEMNPNEHSRIFSASTTSLDSGFQNDTKSFEYFPNFELQEWERLATLSMNSLASGSTESDEDEKSFISSASITLGRGISSSRGTLRRDRRGSTLDMSVALEYVKFKVSSAKKQLVQNRRSDLDINKTQMFIIQIESNMEEIVPHSFSIVRSLEEFQCFYLEVQKKHGKIGNFPKHLKPSLRTKNFERKVEDVLNQMGINSQTRNGDSLMKFIKKDNGLSLITDGMDRHLNIEKTFFTPSISNKPGTITLIEVACKPIKPFATLSRKVDNSSSTKFTSPEQPKPTINRVMKEGHEVLITTTEKNHEYIDAATLDILIENLTTLDQSRNNSRVPDPNFIQQFILGHRHFLKNLEFLTILVKKYEEINKDSASKEQSIAWHMLAKIRILNVVIQWLDTFYPDFYVSSKMSDMLTDFMAELKEKNEAASSIQRIEKIMHEQHNYFDSKQGSNEKRQCKNPCVLLGTTLLKSHSFKSQIIAQQLSIIQMELFKKVGFYEICIKILEGNNSIKNGTCTPNLDAFINRSNQESTWIMSEVLSSESNKIRVDVVEVAISVAKHCYRLKNYNTMMAILAGLQNRLVNRTKAISGICDKSKSTFEKLKRVMDFSGNFKNYRQETRTLLAEGNKPCVPFFALYMKDFTHMNENKKYVGDGLVNFSKIRNMHKILVELKKLQRFPFDELQEDIDLEMQCENLYTLNEEKLEEICRQFASKS